MTLSICSDVSSSRKEGMIWEKPREGAAVADHGLPCKVVFRSCLVATSEIRECIGPLKSSR